jgi:MraZ protein
MIKIRGNFEVTLDPKGRFMLPAQLKKQVGEGVSSYFLMHGVGPFLELYTEAQWAVVEDQLIALNNNNDDVEELMLDMFGTLQPVEIDAAGRITLPKRMIKYADLNKDIVVQGLLTKTLIWDQETFEKERDSRTLERRKELRRNFLGSGYTQSNPVQDGQ